MTELVKTGLRCDNLLVRCVMGSTFPGTVCWDKEFKLTGGPITGIISNSVSQIASFVPLLTVLGTCELLCMAIFYRAILMRYKHQCRANM